MSATTERVAPAPGRRSHRPIVAASARKRRVVERDKRRSTVLTVIVWVSLAYFLIPLVWLFIASTKSNSDLFSTFGLAFGSSFDLFSNIGQVFTQQGGAFSQWLINTVLYSVGSAVGAAALATACGYALAKYRFRGATAVFSVILGAVMVPLTALAIPTFLLFSAWNLTDTPWAIVLPSLVSPFGVYLMRVYAADAVDDSLLEAARIDGAGEFRIFFSIASRLLAPGIVTVLLFTLVSTWNNYFLPLIMLNSPELFPVTVGLASWQASATAGGGGQVLFTTVITGSLLSITPLIVAFLFLQRFWQTGLSSGSVKG
ncbi:carbohydrate ABC transporter permease [Leifsonia sp. ZF2019]|uniref:carbohydrate ABC transporter permease n=1 Tax=Leifsonia sp. ZF2019 TaxID=2781978 RepID=UPI001CBCC100|nr:carbohydrate ABC transporter permease [Leifsonia sp. ZF2019]UAJ79794.1 carbohydrate ABC transporter permease [Leifsonia sp. ZF2019]